MTEPPGAPPGPERQPGAEDAAPRGFAQGDGAPGGPGAAAAHSVTVPEDTVPENTVPGDTAGGAEDPGDESDDEYEPL